MRSLYFKLILVFLAVSLVGTLLAALLIRQHSTRAFDELLREQGRSYFVQDVAAYYQTYGTLDGIQVVIQARAHYIDGRQEFWFPDFALANAQGRVIVPAGPWRPGERVSQASLAAGIPVYADGDRVATVLLPDRAPPRNPLETQYLENVDRALLVGALGATAIAVLLGAILAHTLTRPLRELATASGAVAGGELGRQVPVRTRDELGELATAFNQMSAQIEQVTQQRRQMTADIAHDLRTPLTVLAGYLEAMEDGTLPPTPQRLATMQQEVDGLRRLVDDLRLLSLADAGQITLAREEVGPADLLEQVRQAYAHQAAQEGITLSVDVAPNVPPLSLDPERMRQVLGNLVSNALRHTPSGGTVLLQARAESRDGKAPDSVLLTVQDSGSGIAPEDLPLIFDRFYRGDKARTSVEGASGLGLAIAKSLVAMHGGSISVSSEAGQGAAFFIRLPLA